MGYGLKVKIDKIYKKICNILTIKNISWLSMIGFVLLLLPICYLSFINRATGDDLGFSSYTKLAWDTSHSIFAVLRSAWETAGIAYGGWQGTWFTVFLFTLQPELFHEKGYVVVAFFMLFIWIGSTVLLMRELLGRKLKYDKSSVQLITILFLIIAISFIPRKQPAIFWYVGAAHYTIPFSMCQMVVYWLFKYSEEYKMRFLVGIALFMACLGGANYQAALFALIVAIYFMLADLLHNKNKKTFLLFVPVMLEVIGLVISMKAPGNSVRGGDDFGFTIDKIADTIGKSFIGGIRDVFMYLQTSPMIYVLLFIIFFVTLYAVKEREFFVPIKYGWLLILSLFCLYSAMQAPAIFAAVEVSGGVYNTNFLVFLMLIMTIIVIAAERIGKLLSKKHCEVWNELYYKAIIPGFAVGVLLLLVCRSDIKETTTWQSINYVATGQAADFKTQMDQMTELLTDDSVQNVVVPYMNDKQGPLQHMPATSDPMAFTNTAIKNYYRKESVVAIPREEWEEKYNR